MLAAIPAIVLVLGLFLYYYPFQSKTQDIGKWMFVVALLCLLMPMASETMAWLEGRL